MYNCWRIRNCKRSSIYKITVVWVFSDFAVQILNYHIKPGPIQTVHGSLGVTYWINQKNRAWPCDLTWALPLRCQMVPISTNCCIMICLYWRSPLPMMLFQFWWRSVEEKPDTTRESLLWELNGCLLKRKSDSFKLSNSNSTEEVFDGCIG